jgi:hypothetical protein
MCVLILQRVKVMWSINGILTKKRSTAVEMCAQNYYKAGRRWFGLRQSTTNNTGCPFRITAWMNGDGGWRVITIAADDGTY